MAKIPGVTAPEVPDKTAQENGHAAQKPKLPENAEEPQFEMDI